MSQGWPQRRIFPNDLKNFPCCSRGSNPGPANNQKHNRLQQHDGLLPNQGVPDLPAKRQRSVTRRWLHRFAGWSALCIERSFMQRPQHQCTVCQEAAAAAGADTAHALAAHARSHSVCPERSQHLALFHWQVTRASHSCRTQNATHMISWTVQLCRICRVPVSFSPV